MLSPRLYTIVYDCADTGCVRIVNNYSMPSPRPYTIVYDYADTVCVRIVNIHYAEVFSLLTESTLQHILE